MINVLIALSLENAFISLYIFFYFFHFSIYFVYSNIRTAFSHLFVKNHMELLLKWIASRWRRGEA